jgi:hypothetical protein
MRWVGQVAHMRVMRNAYNFFFFFSRKPEGKRPLGRCRCRWDNIRMDLREMGLEVMDWMYLAQDRGCWWAPMNVLMNSPWVPLKIGNFLTS